MDDLIKSLENEWSKEGGFLGLLREGTFSEDALLRLLQLLDRIDFGGQEVIERRLVSLMWYIPRFMEWQKERLEENGISSERVDAAITEVENRLEEILGVP
jgi:hypothetical protein